MSKIPTTTTGLYIDLFKPRILFFQFITVSMGFYMATFHHKSTMAVWLLLLAGTALTSAGGAALNNAFERDSDAKMTRTQHRGVATGKISFAFAVCSGILFSVLGTLLLLTINPLTAIIGLATVILYVFIYTPMKKMSWLNTYVGAIPGALPPLGGWAAGANSLSQEGWILFLLLFCWQIPHFFAIDWMYKDDYEKGNYKMLSKVDPSGHLSAYNMIVFTLTLIAISFVPYLMNLLSLVYCIGVFIIGIYFLRCGIGFYKDRTVPAARRVLRASIIYLPVMILLFFLDHALV